MAHRKFKELRDQLPEDARRRLDRLASIADGLASTAATRDGRLDNLILASEAQLNEIEELVREWRAYLRTIRPQ